MTIMPVRFRDLVIHRINRRCAIVVACDAVGGLGEKDADTVKIDTETVGYFCARVGLLEMISVRAMPTVISCTLTTEREPTGAALLYGVQSQLREAGLADRVELTMSSETNFATVQTGLGVTVVGVGDPRKMPLDRIRRGDVVYRIGDPRTGLRRTDDGILPIDTVATIVSLPQTHEVIPLGSGGVASELAQLRARGVVVDLADRLERGELERSGGPANAALVVWPSAWADRHGAATLRDLGLADQAIMIGKVSNVRRNRLALGS